jgi:hypothetical protein
MLPSNSGNTMSSNPLNNDPRAPVNTGAHPTNMPATGSIIDPFKPSALPPLRHAALNRGVAGPVAIVTPIAPTPGSAPKQRDVGTNRGER